MSEVPLYKLLLAPSAWDEAFLNSDTNVPPQEAWVRVVEAWGAVAEEALGPADAWGGVPRAEVVFSIGPLGKSIDLCMEFLG